jgi:H+/Cl- antiporter ClcA/CBS domain-containing protein
VNPDLEKTTRAATTDGLTVSPALDLAAEAAAVPPQPSLVDQRTLRTAALAVGLGVAAAVAAVLLTRLIYFVTNLSFYGRPSIEHVSPAHNRLGPWVVLVPVAGAVVVGLMARYGSKAIRGHGIPEAMEQILTNRSRIPARITFLKPLSAAVSIGTGGPFGAEGPIIATGGALGSVIGQFTSTTPAERRTLLAAGAAAGMAATFGCPVSAVLLAIELLLFEFRARSLVPVAFAATAATGIRYVLEGTGPAFPMPPVAATRPESLAFYVLLGAVAGLVAAGVTKLVYVIEDAFERLPVHWMWWPAIGAVAVGVVGCFAPRTLGVGYENITDILSGKLATEAVLFLCVMKFISWSVSLGSGTSGGTLAPLMTIGGGFGASLGAAGAWLLPNAGIDPRVAALVGMASLFAGASRAVLTSVVFAFETTRQPFGLLPLLGGCVAAYFVSCYVMRHTIMTEKIARRGVRTPAEYVADALDRVLVRSIAAANVVALKAADPLDDVRKWISSGAPGSSHQGFPVLDEKGHLVGVVTRRDLLGGPAGLKVRDVIKLFPKFVYDDSTARQAADHMANHGVGRLPVISREDTTKLVGIVTRSDILACYRRSLDEERREAPTIAFPRFRRRRKKVKPKAPDAPAERTT